MRRMPGGRLRASWAAAGAAAVALATVLSACIPSPGPAPVTAGTPSVTATATTSSSTSSATATSTPSSTYPADVPAEARANTLAGAAAFVRYFLAQVNTAYTKPATGLILPLSTSECGSCTAYEEKIAGYVAAGQRYDRPAVEVLEVTRAAGLTASANGEVLDVAIHQLPARIISATGLVDKVTEMRGVLVVWLAHDGQGWRVTTVKVRG